MQGDIVTNADLQDAIRFHMAHKKKGGKGEEQETVIMTKIFAQMPYSNPARDPSQEVCLLLDKDTR